LPTLALLDSNTNSFTIIFVFHIANLCFPIKYTGTGGLQNCEHAFVSRLVAISSAKVIPNPWNRIRKLIITELGKKFSAFYGTGRFSTIDTRTNL
jgi:hypothetical protein